MTYQVIARKWRPLLFADVIGQEHITTTLENAIKSGRIAHAYLFSGPRGVGKTTTARILAKALNCEKGPTTTPCNECSNCLDIKRGASMDVLEIDGASNNGVDEVRNLRDKIRFTPSSGRYKIYIIDEVHMLTTQAFNALLKTLEEPPEHAIFIFATTEIHKVLPTILSRCQRYDFKSIPVKQISSRLKMICDTENIHASDDALLEIAVKADGGMRDAQSLLDQVISFSGEDININHVRQALGLISRDLYFKTSEYIAGEDKKGLIGLVKQISLDGFDLGEFLIGLEEHLRNFLFVKITGDASDLEIADNFRNQYENSQNQFSQADLLKYIQLIQDTQSQIRRSFQPRLKLELLLIKMAMMPSSRVVEEILSIWENDKKKILKADETPLINKLHPAEEGDQLSRSADLQTRENEETETEFKPQTDNVAITIDYIKELWQQAIKDFIDLKKTFLANQMALGLPVNYSGNGIIQIGVSEINNFAIDHIQKNANILEKLFGEKLHRSIRIEVKEYRFSEEEKPKSIQTTNLRLEDLVEKAPILQEIINKFDCKVLRINNINNGNN